MVSRDLVPIAQGCPSGRGRGKPLPIAVDDHRVARGCARAAKLGPVHDDGSICVIERTAGWGDGAGVGETI
jgi:hypothetical protein